MIVLAFDTALAACTAGVWRDGVILACQSVNTPQGHAEARLQRALERQPLALEIFLVAGVAGLE